MTVRMRHTRGHTRNRRSHHSLKEPRLSNCVNCGFAHLRHRACENCGTYKGKQVIDVESKIEKKAQKVKRKEKEMEEMGMKKKNTDNPLKEEKKAQKDADQGMTSKAKERKGTVDLKGLSKQPEK